MDTESQTSLTCLERQRHRTNHSSPGRSTHDLQGRLHRKPIRRQVQVCSETHCPPSSLSILSGVLIPLAFLPNPMDE